MTLEQNINKISEKFYEAKSEIVSKRIELEREKLELEKERLTEKLNEWLIDNVGFEKSLSQYLEIVSNPWSLRDLWSIETKQLLIRVLFWNKIYYKKNEGVQTPHKPLIYAISNHLRGTNIRLGRTTGIEPATTRTTTLRSTNWATSAIK